MRKVSEKKKLISERSDELFNEKYINVEKC